MKNILVLLLVTVLAGTLAAQQNTATPPPASTMVRKVATPVSAPANALTTATFTVNGNCGMCKKTIEKAALSAGVQSADWDMDTHVIKVAFDSVQVKLPAIHQAIAASGYDTDLQRADDKAYEKLHACCQYERKQ